jgi:diguanylate cyclase (GGDEF)-like protein
MAGAAIPVLLVEDNPGDARLMAEMLKEGGSAEFDLTHVSTVRAAVDALSVPGAPYQAILLDLSLPDEHGLDTIRRVVAVAGRSVVVVMTGAGDEELGLSAMQEGAQDYFVKGSVDGPGLRRALRYAIQRGGKQHQLQNESITDDLTGLSNRRGFLLHADQILRTARRERTGFLILFLDLDGLKFINDTFGHAEGNRAIMEAADVLRNCFRTSDLLARLSGDEFAALAMHSTVTAESALRQRLEQVLTTVNGKPGRSYPLGFSVGILACGSNDERPMESLLAQADALMYEDKRRKRGAAPAAPPDSGAV